MKIFCLTPVKNEEWIIDFFLKETSFWADKILLADQRSSDKTLNTAGKYNKVEIITNNKNDYDEGYRQQLLLNRARKSGQHLLFALDADEIFSAGFDKTEDWKIILNSPPGTAFYFRLLNICPDLKYYWSPPLWFNFAYVDDGTAHQGPKLHSPRFPQSPKTRKVYLEQIGVLHLQFINWQRMESKHRWYQCTEMVTDPNLSPIELYRKYHHMDISNNKLLDVPSEILPNKIRHELNTIVAQSVNNGYYWDKLVTKMLAKHGAKYFACLAIWDNFIFKVDPRSAKQKLLHHYLRWSQMYYGSRIIAKLDKIIEKL